MKDLFRRAAAFLLCAALLCPTSLAAGTGYTDVPANAWYAEAVIYCRDRGFMSGTSATEFSPNRLVTRGQLAAVLYRMRGSPETEGESPFTDVKTGDWCGPAVIWASRHGYITGYADGRFDPQDTVTRQQLAAVLWRCSGSPRANSAGLADEKSVASYAVTAVKWACSTGVMNGYADGRFVPGSKTTRAQLAAVLMNYMTPTLQQVSAMDVMCQPAGAAAMEDGSLLVADTYNKVVWRVKEGVSTVYAGSDTVEDLHGQPLGGYNDGKLADSYFKKPWAIVPFLDGWAVSDTENNVVRLLRPQNTETVNGHTSEKLTTTKLGVAFSNPTGLAADEDGNLYVSDTFADAVRKITRSGEVTTVAE